MSAYPNKHQHKYASPILKLSAEHHVKDLSSLEQNTAKILSSLLNGTAKYAISLLNPKEFRELPINEQINFLAFFTDADNLQDSIFGRQNLPDVMAALEPFSSKMLEKMILIPNTKSQRYVRLAQTFLQENRLQIPDELAPILIQIYKTKKYTYRNQKIDLNQDVYLDLLKLSDDGILARTSISIFA
jgi:hypothetical protein